MIIISISLDYYKAYNSTFTRFSDNMKLGSDKIKGSLKKTLKLVMALKDRQKCGELKGALPQWSLFCPLS